MIYKKPEDLRKAIRSGNFKKDTSGQCPGYKQANLVILPKAYADDFEKFCQMDYPNRPACPILERFEAGETCPPSLKQHYPETDIRTDVPLYRIWKDNELVDEVRCIKELWQDDLVSFLIGCSFSFEEALQDAGIEVRNVTMGCNVSMYNTSIKCKSVGKFHGPLVVSMRPIPKDKVDLAIKITAQFKDTHGAPVHVGDPSKIGISDISKPDFGDPVTINEGEVPVFWACGVTSSMAVKNAKPPLCITHAPGYMFVTNMNNPTIKLS